MGPVAYEKENLVTKNKQFVFPPVLVYKNAQSLCSTIKHS